MKRLVAIILSASVYASASARAEDENARFASEAAALFHVVIAAEAPAHRCQFGTEWMHEDVPEYVARKFLGLTLHADLAPPFQITSFRDVLDPEKRQAAAFCNQTESAAFQKAQFDAFEKDKSAKRVRVESTAFALPVFDAAYDKAIVIILRSGIERDRLGVRLGQLKPGDVIRHPGDGAEFANVYLRSNEGWKLIASEMIGQS